MPRIIKKYLCKYKCGKKALSTFSQMEYHEINNCMLNPDNKTCSTCNNQIYERQYNDYLDSFFIRGCKLSIMDNFIDSISGELACGNGTHKKPLFMCPNYNKEIEQPNTNEYIELIKQKQLEIKQDNLIRFNFGTNPLNLE